MYIDSINNPNTKQITYNGHSRQLQKSLDALCLRQKCNPCDVLEISEKIKNIIDTTFVKEKFLGEGTRNIVYKVTRKYVARIPKNQKITKESIGNDLQIGKRLYRHIPNYYGEPFVEMGPLQILRNIGKHIPAGIPSHMLKFLSKSKLNRYYIERYLPIFARVPQSAYDELAKSISALNYTKIDGYKYCEFDSENPNNIVLRKGKFYIVDDIETDDTKYFSNTTAKLLQVFINKAAPSMHSPFDAAGIKNTRRIFKKIILASSFADVPHAETKNDYENWEAALKHCGIKDKAYTVINALEEIYRKFSDSSERKNEALNFINRLYVANPV